MGEHLSGEVYAKVKVALMRNNGLPSRIQFTVRKGYMGSPASAERIVLALFEKGLHALCDDCRRAMREIRTAHETARDCPRRREDGLCKENSHPCNMVCDRVKEAIARMREADGGGNAKEGQ